MAVPGPPAYAASAGTNRLLKSGAALIESAEDVLLCLGGELAVVRQTLSAAPSGLAPDQQRLLDLLDAQARTLDELAAAGGLRVDACAVTLTELELAGFVQRVGGGYIRRPSEF